GGLVGFANYALVSDSYAQGNVVTGLESGSSGGIGGLIGQAYVTDVDATSAIGAVTGSNNVGGLIGAGTSGNLTNSTASGAVTQIGSAGNS
ncbi:GLUG motif-containing protein, partial [Acinetobacter baumannii]